MMRINKYIAKSGISSRRKAENLILSNRISVNGKVINELSFLVADNDIVLLDGKEIKPLEENYYIMLNKPIGYTCTNEDVFAEKTIFDLIKLDTKLFSIGRLDKDSRGLILVTNDGEIYNKIIHPKNKLFKKYLVKLDKKFDEKFIKIFEDGIIIDGYKTQSAFIKINKKDIEISISEGKNRQIRKMFKTLGYKVIDLKRFEIGKIKLGNLKEGEFRFLTDDELIYIKNL